MSSNIQRLGSVLANRMKQTSAAAVPTTIEMGTINGSLGLILDSLPTPVPKGEYMINLHLIGVDEWMANNRGIRDCSECDCKLELPPQFRDIKAGDRVLVVWAGNEPIIVAIVVSS